MGSSSSLPDTGSRILDGVLSALSTGTLATDGLLAPSVTAWFASPEQGLAAALESTSGIDTTAAALSRLAPATLTIAGAVQTESGAWVEVTREATGDAETCLVGCREGSDGFALRVICVRAPLVPEAQEAAGASAPAARPIMERYFDDLQNGRFDEAAQHFTPGTIYSHPPYGGGRERVLYRGRDALLHGFVHDRGESPVRQVITDLWQQGSRVFLEGVIEGIPNGGTFLATAQLNGAGKIVRYVAFYSATRLRPVGV